LSAGQRGSSSEAMPDGHAMTEGQAANPQNLVPVAEGSDRGSDSPRGATAAEGSDRGSATGWGSDAQGQWWGEGVEAMREDLNPLAALQSSLAPRSSLIVGYKRALCHAREAVSDADSCVALKSLLATS
jgi:hypothetical protein